MPGAKEDIYAFSRLALFFDFLREEKERMTSQDIRLLLCGFEIIFARNLDSLSLLETKSIIQKIDLLEEELGTSQEEEGIPPLSAFELAKAPRAIKERMARGKLGREEFERLIIQLEEELQKSSCKITLSQSFALHNEIKKLKEEFLKVE